MEGSTSGSTLTRIVLAAAAAGAAGYAYYHWTQQQQLNKKSSAKCSSASSECDEVTVVSSSVNDAAATAAAAGANSAAATESSDAKTFAQTPEQMEEMQRQAAVRMARLQAAGNMGQDGMGGMKNLTPEECGGVTDKYRWLQSEKEIIVEFPIPKGTKSKQIVVKLETRSVKMAVNGETVLAGKPLKDIVPDECMWEIEEMPESKTGEKKVVVTLHKSKRATLAMHHWNCVVEGEPTVDVGKFGPPIVGINGKDPTAMARMLENIAYQYVHITKAPESHPTCPAVTGFTG